MNEYLIKIISYKKDWLVISIKKDKKGIFEIGFIGAFKELKEADIRKRLVEFILKKSREELKKIKKEVKKYERKAHNRRSSANIG